jgi:hypothetical protein
MTLVLYVVKPPVETVSSWHHRLSIDSQKLEDHDITGKKNRKCCSSQNYPFSIDSQKSEDRDITDKWP